MFVWLNVDEANLYERMLNRSHWYPAELLESQFLDAEPPGRSSNSIEFYVGKKGIHESAFQILDKVLRS